MTNQSTRLAGRNAEKSAERTPHLSSSLFGTNGAKTAEESQSTLTTLSASDSISIEAVGRYFGASSVVVREVPRERNINMFDVKFGESGYAEANAPAIPEGLHSAEITMVEARSTKKTGDPMLDVTLVVMLVREHKAYPHKIHAFFVNGGRDWQQAKFAHLAHAVGMGKVERGSTASFVPQEMIGKEVCIRVKHRKEGDETIADVAGLWALERLSKGAKKGGVSAANPLGDSPSAHSVSHSQDGEEAGDVPF